MESGSKESQLRYQHTCTQILRISEQFNIKFSAIFSAKGREIQKEIMENLLQKVEREQ